MKKTLITRDSKDNIRVINIELNQVSNIYIINRESYLYKGKVIHHPCIYIKAGKVKRTIQQQAELQFNSELKKYLDKGYKDIESLGYSSLNDFDPKTILPKEVTDTDGNKKPMLCIAYNKIDKKYFDKDFYISTKLDGVRMFLFSKNNEIHTSSRGGQNYDIAATYICKDDYIQKLFQKYPNIILDGELYRHGWSLAKISGLSRTEQLINEHEHLYFCCYDIVDENKTFEERLKILNDIKNNRPSNSKLKIVEHTKVHGFDNIMKYHNDFVSLGYEGAVIRVPDAKYKCNARNKEHMIKFKVFSDDEFKIKGLVDGLRDEDMCFLMETKEGYEFKAKPIGDKELKQYYRDNILDIIGQYGTVKYFGYTTTDKPVPNLPVFKNIRDKKDM